MEDKTEIIESTEVEAVPNEKGGFVFSSFLKIFDPETQEILVQERGDN